MRYYLVVIDYNSREKTGVFNFGYSCTAFNKNKVMKAASEQHPHLNIESMVIVNFIEFKDKKDYINFWS